MPITKETKQRIKEDAAKRFPTHADGSHASLSTTWAEQRGYIAGGEAEAELAEKLIEALKQSIIILKPFADFYQQATDVLANYNSKPVK